MLLFLNFSYVVQNQALMKTHKQLVLCSPKQKIKHNLENRAIHSVSVLPAHLCAWSGAKGQEMKVQWNFGKIFLEEAGCCCNITLRVWGLIDLCSWTFEIHLHKYSYYQQWSSKLYSLFQSWPLHYMIDYFFLHFTLFCLVVI